MLDVASLLKLARANLGLSVNALVKETGLSSNTIVCYENDTTEPSIPNLVKLTQALQIPLQEVGIIEEDCLENIDDIQYTKKYTKNNVSFFKGLCKCGKEIFTIEEDLTNNLKIKCKGCVAKKLQDQNIWGLDDSDIEKLYNMFQNNIVRRSIKLQVPCTISLTEYINTIRQNCVYCGEEPNQVTVVNDKVFKHNGIDRLDSTRGYEQNNIVPCCTRCNMMKGSLSCNEFLSLVDKIHEKQKGTN